MDNSTLKKIDEYIDNNRNNIINDLINLVKTPSVQSEPCEGAPFGKDCRRMMDEVCELFRKNGFDAEIYSDGRYALSYYGEGEKTIGLFAHADVVPVANDWIYTTPFCPIEKDGFLIGRGIEDDKAGITICLYLLKMLKELNIPVKNRIMTFIGSSEETGMDDIKYFAKEQKMPDLCFVPDNTFPVTVGEKSMLRFFVAADSRFNQIISISGGDRFNVVLGEAVVEIAYTAELENELKAKISGRKEFDMELDGEILRIYVHGLSAHAAMPEGSVCAAKLAAELLSDCEALDKNDRDIMKSAAFLLTDSYATALNAAHNDERFGRTTASTGIITTQDGKLKFSYDMRFAPDAYEGDIVSMLEKEFSKHRFSITESEFDVGFDLGDDTPVVRKITEAYCSVCSDSNSKPARSGGGTYARYLKNAYSIGVCAPTDVPDLQMPEGHGGAHQPDEKICIEGLMRAIKIITLMVLGCDDVI